MRGTPPSKGSDRPDHGPYLSKVHIPATIALVPGTSVFYRTIKVSMKSSGNIAFPVGLVGNPAKREKRSGSSYDSTKAGATAMYQAASVGQPVNERAVGIQHEFKKDRCVDGETGE
jgi:hypothetical protein